MLCCFSSCSYFCVPSFTLLLFKADLQNSQNQRFKKNKNICIDFTRISYLVLSHVTDQCENYPTDQLRPAVYNDDTILPLYNNSCLGHIPVSVTGFPVKIRPYSMFYSHSEIEFFLLEIFYFTHFAL